MDDDEMGRPPRHERKAKASRGGFLGDVLRRGDGESVRVRGERSCACGEKLHVDFTGPQDSLGVRVARARLQSARCAECELREQEAEDRERFEAGQADVLRRRLERCGLPLARRRALSELQAKRGQAPAIEAAARWARGEVRGVVLHGEVGRGKTVIAASATVERCALSMARWLPVAELLTDLRADFDSPVYQRALTRLQPPARGAALVLDDLDKTKPSEHALQPLYVAINGWMEAQQPLFVTLNRDLDELAEWAGRTFGAALASRLAGYCEVVEVTGEDWRLAA